jgi:anch_rpt_ABC: anchored repeat-type ABC transporter, ATP-binding subunit
MIELKELTLGYGQRTLLETVNARITGGQLVALLGRNGTGKSTLLRAMMGLEKASIRRDYSARKKHSIIETGKISPEYKLCHHR